MNKGKINTACKKAYNAGVWAGFWWGAVVVTICWTLAFIFLGV
jgi:hypothetical protein